LQEGVVSQSPWCGKQDQEGSARQPRRPAPARSRCGSASRGTSGRSGGTRRRRSPSPARRTRKS